MGSNSNIEWTHHTFNPWRGCTKVSDGCKNCYADTLSKRNPGTLGVWGPNGSRVLAAEAYWRQALKWNAEAACIDSFDCGNGDHSDACPQSDRPRVFCASLADVFEDWSGDFPDLPGGGHGGVRCMVDASGARLCTRVGREVARQWPDEAGWRPYTMEDARDRLFQLIAETPNLDWLLLTKRPELAGDWLRAFYAEENDVLPNVWLGTSVENQQTADERIPHLLNCPAAVRFLSCEPLLGAVDLTRIPTGSWSYGKVDVLSGYLCGDEPDELYDYEADPAGWIRKPAGEWDRGEYGIDWVIAGGESGSGARPMHPDWARSLRDQCQAAGVAFFFKQHGGWLPAVESTGPLVTSASPSKARVIGIDGKDGNPHNGPYALMSRVGKKAAGRELDGRTWNEMPEQLAHP